MNTSFLPTPLGLARLTYTDHALCSLWFLDPQEEPTATTVPDDPVADHHPIVGLTARALAAYFQGDLTPPTLPLAPHGTAFQRQVWAVLGRIPAGSVCHYVDVARQVDRPRASRAVGAAIGRNPIALFIPCHRVVGRDGSLTGYAGGLHRKAQLLRREGVLDASDRARPEAWRPLTPGVAGQSA